MNASPVRFEVQSSEPARRLIVGCLLLTLGVVLVWHWPVLAGKQPAGSDVTAFFYPLMVDYSHRLVEGRLPLWNPLWGFGFPGLAESQMGVFYPPHLLLFGLLDVDLAYSLNLLLHQLLAAGFAFWCARTFGLSPWAAALVGVVFSRGGFFVSHAVHQWAYTAGCWLPLALLITWKLCRPHPSHGATNENSGDRSPVVFSRHVLVLTFLLALVLGVQMLAGHFQIAFCTQVTVLLVGLARGVQAVWKRPTDGRREALSPAGPVVLAWLSALGLSALQLLPTAELAELTSGNLRHDHLYLSHFANPPWHFVQYLFPLLLHRNPLWEPVAWEPWRTSPVESSTYVGLLPLCLALGGLWLWRKDPRIQLLVLLLVVTVFLSLGPFAPGFRALIALPGFGWFRSTARWSLVTTLVLGLIAGFALDRLDAARFRRWTLRFCAVCSLALLVVLGCMLLLRKPPKGDLWGTAALETVGRWTTPWDEAVSLVELRRRAHRPQEQLTVLKELVRLGEPLAQLLRRQPTLASALPEIAKQELAASGLALIGVAILALAVFRRPRLLPAAVLAFTVADLSMLGLLHRIEWVPRGALRGSPFTRWLDEHAAHQRIVALTLDNYPMAAGAAPIVAYRTLHIELFDDELLSLNLPDDDALPEPIAQLLRLAGVEYHLAQWSPHAMRSSEDPPLKRVAGLEDPLLDGILLGPKYAEQLRALMPATLTYRIFRAAGSLGRCWTVPLREMQSVVRQGAPLPGIETVRPAQLRKDHPEHLEIEASVTEPSLLVVPDLYYPGWEATLHGVEGAESVPLIKVLDGGRGVRLKQPGTYRVSMTYRCQPLRDGALLAAAVLLGWIVVLTVLGMRGRRKGAPGRQAPLASTRSWSLGPYLPCLRRR